MFISTNVLVFVLHCIYVQMVWLVVINIYVACFSFSSTPVFEGNNKLLEYDIYQNLLHILVSLSTSLTIKNKGFVSLLQTHNLFMNCKEFPINNEWRNINERLLNIPKPRIKEHIMKPGREKSIL